jgi:hypothetical protein
LLDRLDHPSFEEGIYDLLQQFGNPLQKYLLIPAPEPRYTFARRC